MAEDVIKLLDPIPMAISIPISHCTCFAIHYASFSLWHVAPQFIIHVLSFKLVSYSS